MRSNIWLNPWLHWYKLLLFSFNELQVCISLYRVLFGWVSLNQNLNWRKISFRANENSKSKQGNCLKCGKTRVTKSWFVSVLHLIGWESSVSFLERQQSEVELHQCTPGLFSLLPKVPESLRKPQLGAGNATCGTPGNRGIQLIPYALLSI